MSPDEREPIKPPTFDELKAMAVGQAARTDETDRLRVLVKILENQRNQTMTQLAHMQADLTILRIRMQERVDRAMERSASPHAQVPTQAPTTNGSGETG